MPVLSSVLEQSIDTMYHYSSPWHLLLFIVVLASPCCHYRSLAGADPTSGFVPVELTEDRFKLHKPYDLPPEQRYEFRDGVRRMWAFCTDKPLTRGSHTKPSSEILLNLFGALRASGRNTTLMLHVDHDIHHWWIRLNVGADEPTVFIDGEERLAVAGRGSYRHHFKFAVSSQTDPSHYMESRWRDVKVHTKISE